MHSCVSFLVLLVLLVLLLLLLLLTLLPLPYYCHCPTTTHSYDCHCLTTDSSLGTVVRFVWPGKVLTPLPLPCYCYPLLPPTPAMSSALLLIAVLRSRDFPCGHRLSFPALPPRQWLCPQHRLRQVRVVTLMTRSFGQLWSLPRVFSEQTSRRSAHQAWAARPPVSGSAGCASSAFVTTWQR